jgi:hypothetical protein
MDLARGRLPRGRGGRSGPHSIARRDGDVMGARRGHRIRRARRRLRRGARRAPWLSSLSPRAARAAR